MKNSPVLWVALHFPQFRRQALSRGHALPEPEREALAAVAAWACQFTPRVSVEPPQAVLMEVGGSLRYFGGRWKFLTRLRAGLTRLGFEARIAEAPAPRAALWKARGDGERLEALPVAVIDVAPDALELLSNLGIRTVGGLMRLPREDIARRFGPALVDQLERATGDVPDARALFVPPELFSAQLELPAQLTQAESALFAARRLLEQMEGFLTARHFGVRCFCLALIHPGIASTEVRLSLAAPGRSAEHFARLLRERLARTTLAEPVEAIRIEAKDFEPHLGTSRTFFPDSNADGEEWLRLIERLQARLGGDAVFGLMIRQDHRPERAWCPIAPGEGLVSKEVKEKGQRPLWLLESPRRLKEGQFVLLAGPERVESGWWDGVQMRRDYFIARIAESSLVWIYLEREGNWFLHGFFA